MHAIKYIFNPTTHIHIPGALVGLVLLLEQQKFVFLDFYKE